LADYLSLSIAYQEYNLSNPTLVSSTVATTTPGSIRTTLPHTSTSTSDFSAINYSTGSPFKDKLMAVLNIPVELANHKDVNLGFAWQKYKACLIATKSCNSL
jgi:hypothetical protein